MTWTGYPYETWDEIGVFNLAGDPPTTGYSYGPVGVLLQKVALTLERRSQPDAARYSIGYSNNALGSLDLTVPRAGNYNYHRGLANREPIFVSRRLHVVLTYVLFSALLTLLMTAGREYWPAAAMVYFFLLTPEFRLQSYQSLPNAFQSANILIFVAATVLWIRQPSAILLAVSAVSFTAGLFSKLDMLPLAAPAALAYAYVFRTHAAVRRSVGMALAAAAATAVVLNIPSGRAIAGDMANHFWQLRAMAGGAVNYDRNFAVLRNFVDTNVAEFLMANPGVLGFTAGVTALAAWGAVSRRRRQLFAQPEFVQLGFLVFCLALLWLIPALRIAMPYERYYLNALAVLFLSVGLVGGVAMARMLPGRSPVVRMAALLAVAVYLVTSVEAVMSGRTHRDARAAFQGLDPSHSRNQAVLEALRLIRAGRVEPIVVVDQHSYMDIRPFLLDGVKVELVNLHNHMDVLSRVECMKRCLLLQASGEYEAAPVWVTKWSDEEQRAYDQYASHLSSFRRLAGWGTQPMRLLHPAPVRETDEIVLREIGPPAGPDTRGAPTGG